MGVTHASIGLFVEKLQSVFGLAGYDILFAYFAVEVKKQVLGFYIGFIPSGLFQNIKF